MIFGGRLPHISTLTFQTYMSKRQNRALKEIDNKEMKKKNRIITMITRNDDNIKMHKICCILKINVAYSRMIIFLLIKKINQEKDYPVMVYIKSKHKEIRFAKNFYRIRLFL